MIIRSESGDISVIEAVGPVRIIPLDDWIAQGVDRKFAVIRLKETDYNYLSKNNLFDSIISEAKKFLGRPYDFRYRLDDQYIYCSELVYKAFKNAVKWEIAKKVKLKELNYKVEAEFIKKLEGGDVPLERVMVTPIDIYNSTKFQKIFSSF